MRYRLCAVCAYVLSHFSCSDSLQSMDCSLLGSSVHGILQGRILKWFARPSCRESSRPGIKPSSLMSPALAGSFFTASATWESHIGLTRSLYLLL